TRNDSVERIFRFPLTFGDVDSTAISYLTSVPFFGAYGQSGTRHNTVDGWGELATPYGIFNTVRVKSEIALTDTLYIEQTGTGQSIERPLQTIYYWLSPDVPGPVLEMSVVEGNVTAATMYVDDSVLSTRHEIISRSLGIYPNPAVAYINLDLSNDQPYTISIYDISGKLILQKNNVSGRIDINALSPGVYIAQVSSKSGEAFIGKFTVSD
ncbi:MAG TPA: T9SS type A sorting domain-containing protein, partial [Cryomorphaceae bacterium]|nr:T9SS type A sorting domain-containing protein [Cryomorphaceae bacterium]